MGTDQDEVIPPPPAGFTVEPEASAYAKPGPYLTKLSSDEETRFQDWRARNKDVRVVGNWQDTPTTDYDMRGYWKANQGALSGERSKFDGEIHLNDEYKTPYHRTFSNESRYATPDAPHWVEDRLIDKDGNLLADETPIPPPPPGFKVEAEQEDKPAAPARPPVPQGFTNQPVPAAGDRMRWLGIPHELRGYTEDELNAPGVFQNPRTGQRSTVRGDLTRIPFYDAPITGGEEAIHGAEQMTRGTQDEQLRGAGHILAGSADAATPVLATAGAFAPLAAAAWYAISKGIANIAQGTAEKAGASKEDAQLTGRVAGAIPFVYGFGKIAEGQVSDAIDAHNTRAAELLEQERAHGRGVELGEHLVSPEGIELQNTAGWKVIPNGASKQGRPNYTVVDQNGKALFGGNAREVQTWLAAKGVERTAAAMPQEPAPIVEQAPEGNIPAPPPGFTVENESPLTREAEQVGKALQPEEEEAAPAQTPAEPVEAEPSEAPAPSPQPIIPSSPREAIAESPAVVSPAVSEAEIPAPPAGFTVEPSPQNEQENREVKPAHELTFREYRETPEATSVPAGHLLARDPDEPGYWDDLADAKKDDIQNVARVMGAPISGNKQQLIDRLRDVWDLRKTLKDADVDSLQSLSAKELKALAERAGSFKGNKRQTAAGLLNWRNSARSNGQNALAEAQWIARIQQAQAKGLEVPEAVLKDARSRGLLPEEEIPASEQSPQAAAEEMPESAEPEAPAEAREPAPPLSAGLSGPVSPELVARLQQAIEAHPEILGESVGFERHRYRIKAPDGSELDLGAYSRSSKHQYMTPLSNDDATGEETRLGIVGWSEGGNLRVGYMGSTMPKAKVEKSIKAILRTLKAAAPQSPQSPQAAAEEMRESEPAAEEQPRRVVSMATADIHADPVRFQYKRDTGGEAGVGEELKKVKKFDPELGGVILVWRDPENSKTYVVNGHHRLELAKRTGEKSIDVRFTRAKTAGEARVAGAIVNISEGRGTAIDAAKVFRESGFTPEELETRGVSLEGQKARQGMALAQLADPIFERVVQGELPVERAVILGEALPKHEEQLQALALIDKAETRGRRPTNAEIKELIDFVKHGPKETVVSEQTNMFGEAEVEQNAAWEKAEISDYIRKRIGQEKRLFDAAGNARAAELLGKAGNVIKAEENARVAENAKQAQAIYDKLKTSAGEINDVLDRSARQLVHEPAAQQRIKSDAYDAIRAELSRVIPGSARESAQGRGGASESRAGSSSEPGAAQADGGEDEPGPLLLAARDRDLSDIGQFFYSPLERVITEKMPAKVSPAQALAILQNPQHGVKADELKWTGLADWLGQQSGTLTRDAILKKAQDERVSVRESVADRSPKYKQYILPGDQEHYHELLLTFDRPQPPAPEYQAYRKTFDELEAKYGGERRYADSYGHRWRWFNDGAIYAEGGDPLTREERENYTNVLDAWDLASEAEQRGETRSQYLSSHWTTKNVLAHARFDSRKDEQGGEVFFIEEIQSDWHQAGREKGYRDRKIDEERNRVMARVRRLHREGTTEAERKDYFTPGAIVQGWAGHLDKVLAYEPTSGSGADWKGWRVRVQELHADGEPFGMPRWHSTDPANEIAHELEKQFDTFRGQGNRVPDAPFQKTWHELMFRRLAHWAASRGYDRIGWTTGAQQAGRYSLAKHVDGVAWAPYSEETNARNNKFYTGRLDTPEQRQTGQLFVKQKGLDKYEAFGDTIRLAELPEYLGKEVAHQLLAQPLVEGRHSLEAKDLQVGGHGMSGFYDGILPAYAAKFGKKWNAKVGMTKIDTTDRDLVFTHYEGPEYSLEQINAAHDVAMGLPTHRNPLTGEDLPDYFNSGRNARMLEGLATHLRAGTPFNQAVDQIGPTGLAELLGGRAVETNLAKKATQAVHTLEITPAMRQSIEDEGLPLFAKPLKGAPYNSAHYYTNAEILRDADWELLPANNRRPARLRVNWQAAQLARRALGIRFTGVVLDSRALPHYAARLSEAALDWLAVDAITTEEAHRLSELAAAFLALQNAAGGGPVYLYRAEAPHSQTPGARLAAIRQVAATQREEQTHVQQALFTRALKNHGRDHVPGELARPLLDDPAWPTLAGALLARDYPRAVLLLEAGAQLIAGRLDRLGDIAEPDAARWLDKYRRALAAAHGTANANEVFRYADPRFRLKGQEGPNARTLRSGNRSDAALHRGHRNPGSAGPSGNSGQSTPRRTGAGGEEDGGGTLRDAGRGEERSLFGADENEDVASTAARDRDQLEGERLTAQLNAPLTRDEQLKKLKRSKVEPQKDLFQENEEPPQGMLFARDPHLRKLLDGAKTPTAKQVAEVLALYKDDVLKLLAPAARGEVAHAGALIVRANAAELARSTDRAEAALRVAKKYFDKQTEEDNFAFIDRVEHGEAQPTPELQRIANVMRHLLDTRREAVRALGKGKLERFIENYFPHMWKKPKVAAEAFANYRKQNFEGSKSFLKRRSIEDTKTGLALGLEPISTNPVELVLLKAREMDKYLMAHRILAQLKERGLLRYVDAREGRFPVGWQKIDDPVSTVYGQSIQAITEYPNEGLWSGLEKVAAALGIKHERGFLNLRGAVGRARPGGGIQTMHGSAEDVIAHEIGHQIDWLAGSGRRFVLEYPDRQTVERLRRARKTLKDKDSSKEERKAARRELDTLKAAIAQRKQFAKELRELADLRSGRKEYTHKREEKMAQLAEMWVGSRELFERTAPTVFKEWKQFLDQNPKLHALRDIEGNTEVLPISQPYDVGGLVIKGHWWAPEPVARIVNNYLSPGLRDKSMLFRGFLGAGNLLNQAQLGFSAFHLSFTTIDVATSKMALGIYQLAHGDVAEGLANVALTPFSPVTNILRGDQMLKEWYAPGTQGERFAKLVDAVVTAGGRAHMDSFYQTQVTKRMMEAFRALLPLIGEGRLVKAAGKAVKGTALTPFAFMEQAARPIMEYIVPRQKLGVFSDLAEYELARLGKNASDEEAQAALARAWDSTDNRLGQLVYDNLAWNKVVKDLAMASVRSVGWNVGTLREIGGGAVDTLRFAGHSAKSLKQLAGGRTLPMKDEGDNLFVPDLGAGGKGDFTTRMSYLIALQIVAGLAGGVAYYLWHGRRPEKLKDYYFPTDAHHHRWSLATYIKDEYEWTHDPTRTAAGKVHPLLALLWEMLANKDYYSHDIANPHHPFVKRQQERADYVLRQYIPLAYRNDKKHHVVTNQERLLGFFGIKPAPKALK